LANSRSLGRRSDDESGSRHSNYEKLAERTRTIFESSKEKSAEWIGETLAKAAEQLKEASELMMRAVLDGLAEIH